MLPLVTGHDVEVVHVVEVLVVLSIGTQLQVLLALGVIAGIAPVVGGVGDIGTDVVAITASEVTTQGEVQPQVLKAVDLIVDLGSTDEGVGFTTVVMVVEHSHGVVGGIGVLGVGPSGIRTIHLEPLKVATHASIHRVIAANGLRRVHADGVAHSTGVGPA